MIQLASDAGNADGLVFFLFDLLHLDDEDLTGAGRLIERKERLRGLLSRAVSPLAIQRPSDRTRPGFLRACLRR